MSTDGRWLRCTVCWQWVLVFEQPREYIDPALYVCGDAERHRGQLALEQPAEPRQETRPYDPAISRLEF